ncbi:casein kinase I [Friedmanniomyces endolithicus]|uniref:non-specific serine/threonine protein kinase n=1 Tax=Rachicladosporium monterosium TaxID=1507873 RepID=A0ABR0KYF4_9PEZI|nr:casein kinase I [Friedmanniomyces endolithicus]KAK5140632.1 Casein kinase I isoform epsilon [Rachicladosporium monterosium]
MSGFVQRLQENRIDDRFSLIHKPGEAVAVLSISQGRDHKNDQEVALKLEYRYDSTLLKEEIRYYESFQGLPGFPEVYWSGEKDDYNVMVLELLGPSLEDLFAYCEHQFSLKTTLMLADQLLARLKAVHSKGFIHRDVKPGNFLMGTGEDGNTVYITDFGISTDYVSDMDDG